MFHNEHRSPACLESVVLIWTFTLCVWGVTSNTNPRVSPEKQPIHLIAVGDISLHLFSSGFKGLTCIFTWKVPLRVSLKDIHNHSKPGLICSHKGKESMLKSLWDLHSFGSISQPLACRSSSQTSTHTWDFWLEECVCVYVCVCTRAHVCVCCFPSQGVFSMSPGCAEVRGAPGVLCIKATCLCFSFLRARRTCSSHTRWSLVLLKVLETFYGHVKLFDTCMMTQRLGKAWKIWLDISLGYERTRWVTRHEKSSSVLIKVNRRVF